jgi:hypothetical protein
MKKRLLLVGALVVVSGAVMLAAAGGTSGAPQTGPQTEAQKFEAPVDVDTANLPGPQQPIFYRHDVHAGQYEIDCRYCHYAVEDSPNPGMPTVSTCMGCHVIAGVTNPEVQKLREAWNEKRPIEWAEVHVVPPFVRFPHDRHVLSEQGSFGELETIQKCEECHGPVRETPQIYQFASLKMGWCITCHEQQEVTTDCTACHY